MNIFILTSFLLWRSLLFLISFFGSFYVKFTPRFPYSDIFLIPSGLPSWIWSLANFDGVHYLTIAKEGYKAQFTQVFFPFYPFLLSIFNKLSFYSSNLLIYLIFTNLIFLFSLFIFYKLLKLDYSKDTIKWIIIFLIAFPTSFYFGSLYTEGLFIFLVFSSFYFARKKNWILSSIFSAIATATRFVGIFLLPALIWEWYQNKKNKNILFSPILYIAPLGLVAYMIYLQIAFGDWLYFWHAQPIFGASREGTSIILLPQVFWRYFKILTTVSLNKLSFWIPLSELIATILGIYLLIIAHFKKIRTSYLIFAWPALILPTLTGTLSSMPRYLLAAFPVFIVLGLIKNKFLKIILLSICCLLSIVFIILFTRGLWVA